MKRLLAGLVCWLLDHQLELTHMAANKMLNGLWGAGGTVKCRRCGKKWYL